jgi:hypothetical protein
MLILIFRCGDNFVAIKIRPRFLIFRWALIQIIDVIPKFDLNEFEKKETEIIERKEFLLEITGWKKIYYAIIDFFIN